MFCCILHTLRVDHYCIHTHVHTQHTTKPAIIKYILSSVWHLDYFINLMLRGELHKLPVRAVLSVGPLLHSPMANIEPGGESSTYLLSLSCSMFNMVDLVIQDARAVDKDKFRSR